MKRASFAIFAVVVAAGLAGCHSLHGRAAGRCMVGSCADNPQNCAACGPCAGGCCEPGCWQRDCSATRNNVGGRPGLFPRLYCGGDRGGYAGPPTGAITYPYYTVRGPRDFLARSPQSIGP